MPDSVKLWHWWNAGENAVRPEAHWGLAVHGDYSVPDTFGNRYDYRFEQVVPDANHEFSVWMYNADDTEPGLPRHGDPSLQTIDPGGITPGAYTAPADDQAFVLLNAGPEPTDGTPRATLEVVSTTRIDVSWFFNGPHEDGYMLQQKTGQGSWVTVAFPLAGENSYVADELTPDTLYSFRIRAISGLHGDSAYSDVVYARTSSSPPAAPSGLEAEVTPSGIQLTWLDNADNENTYYVEWSIDGGQNYNLNAVLTSNSTGALVQVGYDRQYMFRVRAQNNGGYSYYSNIVEAHSLPQLPTAPTGLTATPGFTWVGLHWNAGLRADSYEIERSTAGGSYELIGTRQTNETTFFAGNLARGTEYTFRVRAVNRAGASGYAGSPLVTTLESLPDCPDVMAFIPPQGDVELTWTQTNPELVDGYRIYQRIDQGEWTLYDGTLGPEVRSATVPGSTELNAVSVFYEVKAYNTGGECDLLPPAAPTNLTANAMSETQIGLLWDHEGAPGDVFVIERMVEGEGWEIVGTTNLESFSMADLTGATEYAFRVRVENAAGSSATSNTAAAVTHGMEVILGDEGLGGYVIVDWPNYAYEVTSVPDATGHRSPLSVKGSTPPGTINDAFTGSPVTQDGWVDLGNGAVIQMNYEIGDLVNGQGPDLAIFGVDFAGDFYDMSVLTSGGWVQRAVTMGRTGASREWVHGGVGEGTTIWAGTVELTDFGVAPQEVITSVRVHVKEPEADLLGVGVLQRGVVDVVLDEVPEQTEETVGAVVAVNDDDDNVNQVADLEEIKTIAEENDLIPMKLDFDRDESRRGATVTLSVSGGGAGNVKVWESRFKGEPHTMLIGPEKATHSWRVGWEPIPEFVYVEGLAPSAAARDVTFTLNYKHQFMEASDTAKATVLGADLDIDSDNDGTIAEADDAIEDDPSKPGKIVTVNHNDDDLDQVPDYAAAVEMNDKNLVPLSFAFAGHGAVWSQTTMAFTYAGENSLPSFESAQLDGDYKDYSQNKLGTMRLYWVGPEGLSYVVPGHPYFATDLLFSGGTLDLRAEGINAGVSTIEVSVQAGSRFYRDAVRVTIIEANLGFNHSNNSTTLRTGTPDVEFAIDQHDEVVEDQGEGFEFWWGGNSDAAFELGIVDLDGVFPFIAEIPQELVTAGYEFYLGLQDGTPGFKAFAYNNLEGAGQRLDYLSDEDAVNGLVQSSTTYSRGALEPESPLYLRTVSGQSIGAGTSEFLFRALGGGGSMQQVFALMMKAPGTTEYIPLDSAVVTIKNADQFVTLVSARGTADSPVTEPSVDFLYPFEDTRIDNVQTFDYDVIHDNRDPDVDATFVYTHGFNNDFERAHEDFGTIHKRLFWQGFRGNFVGFEWYGDYSWVGVWEVPYFTEDVNNAFLTAPALYRFLTDVALNSSGWGLSAENVDIGAHSLGNLVMWEMLRINEIKRNQPIVRNVISIEPALPAETFDEETPLTYAHPSDPITYSITEQKQMSWRFWFRQAGRDIRDSIGGEIIHSYALNDVPVSEAFRANDYFVAGNMSPYNHYDRSDGITNPPIWRSPLNMSTRLLVFEPNSRVDVDPLITGAQYGYVSLRQPLGNRPNPIADHNVNAWEEFDWGALEWNGQGVGDQTFKHSDHTAAPFVAIRPWYEQIFNGLGGVPIGIQ